MITEQITEKQKSGSKIISKSELTNLVEKGLKLEDISNHYGLNQAQTKRLLKDCNLKIRKFHKPAYIITD